MNSSVRGWLLPALKGVFGLLAAFWLGWAFFGASEQDGTLAGGWRQMESWLFVIGWSFFPLGLAVLWRWTLVFFADVRLAASTTLTAQGLAWAGRYMPGKAGLLLGKLTIVKELSATWRELSFSVLAEQMLYVLAGFAVVALMLPLDAHMLQAAAISGLVDKALVLAAEWLWRGIAFGGVLFAAWLALKVAARMLSISPLRGLLPQWLLVFGGHFLLQLMVGAALYPLVVQMLPLAAGALGVTGVAAVFALANCAGILAIVAPAGLGVREAVLAVCLSHEVGFDAALQVAVWVRVLTLVADAAFAGLAIGAGWALSKKDVSGNHQGSSGLE